MEEKAINNMYKLIKKRKVLSAAGRLPGSALGGCTCTRLQCLVQAFVTRALARTLAILQ